MRDTANTKTKGRKASAPTSRRVMSRKKASAERDGQKAISPEQLAQIDRALLRIERKGKALSLGADKLLKGADRLLKRVS